MKPILNSHLKVLKSAGNTEKEAIKARIIDMQIAYVSNYRIPVTKSSNWIPVIGHPHDARRWHDK